MYFVVFTTDKDGQLELREKLRPEHRVYLRVHNHPVEVVIGGPTFDNGGTKMNGTLLVIEAETVEQVKAYLAEDPYVQNDLFESVVVRPWHWGLGFPEVSS